MKKDIKYFKYNEDDILEIITEYLAGIEGMTSFRAKAAIFGKPQKDLRIICAIMDISDSDCIEALNNIDLQEIDKSMDFNGTHKPENYISRDKFLKLNPKDML